MKIGFVGAGKVGCTLGKYFVQHGIVVTGYYSRHQLSADEAAAFTESKSFSSLADLTEASDAIFLTVPDGEITAVYNELQEMNITSKQICHCSGALSWREAFPGIEETGATGYSIHPLFPISSKTESYRELSGVFFCIEGDAGEIGLWKHRLEAMQLQVQIIPAESKIRYHAACAISSNLICALVEESLDLLESCGFSRSFALEALTPLMRSNMEHLIADGPVRSLTGPVERCDIKTIRKHLSSFPNQEERELYRYASLKALAIAEKKHPETDFITLKETLEENKQWEK